MPRSCAASCSKRCSAAPRSRSARASRTSCAAPSASASRQSRAWRRRRARCVRRAAELHTRLEEEREQSQEKLKLCCRGATTRWKTPSSRSRPTRSRATTSPSSTSRAPRSTEFQQGARGDLDKRQVAIDALVAPVQASLEKVDEKIGALEKAREHAYGEIRQQFTQMAEVQNQLRDETGNLVQGAAPAARARPLGRDPAAPRGRDGRA